MSFKFGCCSGHIYHLFPYAFPRRIPHNNARTQAHNVLPPLPDFSATTAIIPVGERGPTAVHRALEINEIRGQLFDLLEWDDKKRTLASMARVCRMFTEQALDVLWHKLVGLKPLLALLPISISGGVMVCASTIVLCLV
jgi:hypothetical protein